MSEHIEQDWTGNTHAVFATLGASNHSNIERQQYDYYATEPRATEVLLEVEQFAPTIWEPACGEGHISKVLEQHGYDVISTDLIYRGFGDPTEFDFLKFSPSTPFNGDIVTNPPYKYAIEFVEKALECVQNGSKVAMLLRLQFLEGKARKQLFMKNPPKVVYVSSSRLTCAMNGDFSNRQTGAVAYAWFVWEKGFKGDPIIKWIN